MIEPNLLRAGAGTTRNGFKRDGQQPLVDVFEKHCSYEVLIFITQADFELDPEVRNRPIVLQSKDGHALWVSQKVIDAMEVIPDEVEGGVIVRDSSGKPTGTLSDPVIFGIC